MTKSEVFKAAGGKEKFLPCFVDFGVHIHEDGREEPVINMMWQTTPGTLLQIYHTTDGKHWEPRPGLKEVPVWGIIGDRASIATGPWDMAFIVEQK